MATKGLTLEDVSKLLGVSVVHVANLERAGSLPFVRITERDGAFYTDPASAIDLFKMGKRTGYVELPSLEHSPAIQAVDRAVRAEQAEAQRVNHERAMRDQAIRDKNKAAHDAALAATGTRLA